MGMSKIITAAFAITLISATASVAHPAGRGFDGRDRIDSQVTRQVNRQGYRQSNRVQRRVDRRNYRSDMRQFRRGGRAYRYDYNEFRRFHRSHSFHFNPRRHVVVNDWHSLRLHRPPRGYHWVRNGNSGDFILAAITTGVILDLMFGHY